MRLSDKMTETRHRLDDVYEELGDGIQSAMNRMFAHGAEAERLRIIRLLENRTDDSGSVLDETGNSIADLSDLVELIKGETNE